MSDKIIPLADAVNRFVSDDDVVALGGWIITRCVVAAVHEIIRQRKKNLTVLQGLSGFDTDLLVGAGAVKRLVTSAGTLDAFGLLNRVNDLFAQGRLELENNTNLGMATRFLAGSLGVPYLPTRSMLGSQIVDELAVNEKNLSAIESRCPFTGENLVLLRALNPKIAIIHVQRADKVGNAQVDGPIWETQTIAAASDRVLLTTEEIVDEPVMTKSPERTIIPAFKVVSVSHVPFGAYPTSCYRYYDYDALELEKYSDCSKVQNKFDDYIKENVLGNETFEKYLDVVCPEGRREKLRARLDRGY